MKITHKTIHPADPAYENTGRIDKARVDATTENDIARHIAIDETEAMMDAARFARRVRKRLRLSRPDT